MYAWICTHEGGRSARTCANPQRRYDERGHASTHAGVSVSKTKRAFPAVALLSQNKRLIADCRGGLAFGIAFSLRALEQEPAGATLGATPAATRQGRAALAAVY